jgi:crotonobetainyl-CoA:carnitine CoA-transferase CaiB-like acyl-CoA transferase
MAAMPVVLERGSSVAVAYCGRLLGLLGFDVVKVEPPGGDPMRWRGRRVPARDGASRSALFEYLACFKRSVVLDEDTASGRDALGRLIAGAAVVIDDHDGDPAAAPARYAAARSVNPEVVYLVVSSFGLTGPYAGFRGNDFVDLASSGYLYVTGQPTREPVQAGGPWAGYATGAVAATAVLAALRLTARTGEGQMIDLGSMEAMASLHQWALTMYTHTGYVKRRAGNRTPESFHPMTFYPCRDGWVCLGIAFVPQWEGFCLALDLPELLLDERFETGGSRYDHADELDDLFVPRLLDMTVDEVVRRMQEHRVPAGPVLDLPAVLADRHLRFRPFWARPPELPDGAVIPERPFHVEGEAPFSGAPGLGAHTAEVLGVLSPPPAAAPPAASPFPPAAPSPAPRASTPCPAAPGLFLDGIRVLELTVGWAGPLAGRYLADYGAEVIHIEAPLSRGGGLAGIPAALVAAELAGWSWGRMPGPTFRSGIFPDADPGEHPWNRAGVFNKVNRNKRSLCLDLKAAEAHDIFVDLVKASDVVVNNFSPRGVASLGLQHEVLASYNPNIVSVSLSGYGHTGPDFDRAAWGQILEAHSGLAAATGYPGDGPQRMGHPFPDAIAGVHCALAVLGALRQRDRLGHGVSVDLSQLESYASIGGELYLSTALTGAAPAHLGNRSLDVAPQGLYPCVGDDQWLAVSVETDDEWAALAQVLGGDMAGAAYAVAAGRQVHHDAIDLAVTQWSRSRDKLAAMKELQAVGVRASAAFTTGDIVDNEHIAARGFMVEWDQVDVGVRRFPGFPVHFQHPAELPMRSTAALGGDNEYVLTEILDYTPSQVDKLTEAGVLATRPPGA